MPAVSLISYIDRNTPALPAPTILKDTGLSAERYGFIISACSIAYTAANPLCGRRLDRVGVRRGMTPAVSLWTAASAAHALAAGFTPSNEKWACSSLVMATARRGSSVKPNSDSSVSSTASLRSSMTRPKKSVHLRRSLPFPVACSPVRKTTRTGRSRSSAADGRTISAAKPRVGRSRHVASQRMAV
jgi:Major Facilitator Superfamily